MVSVWPRSDENHKRTAEFNTDSVVTIGRSTAATFPIDTDDLAMPRRALTIEFEKQHWWIRNSTGAKRPALAVHYGAPTPDLVASGQRRAVDWSTCTVYIPGSVVHHRVRIERTTASTPRVSAADIQDEPTTREPFTECTDQQRMALAAVFESFLVGPGIEPARPRSYRDAGIRLGGLTSTTIRKRIEAVKDKLVAHGVFGADDLDFLGRYVVITGMITIDHVRMLDEQA